MRLGLVQMALGSIVVLTTSTLNRVMVVELALPAVLPGLLVAFHYGVQISRPSWGYASDRGGNRTRWIVGGMVVLAIGGRWRRRRRSGYSCLRGDRLGVGLLADRHGRRGVRDLAARAARRAASDGAAGGGGDDHLADDDRRLRGDREQRRGGLDPYSPMRLLAVRPACA